MDVLLAATVAITLVLAATVVGFVLRRRSGRKRRVTVAEITADDVDVAALAPVATVVQFSTEYCARCPGVRRALVDEVAGDLEVRYTEVDLTDRPQLATRLRILQTPTVLVVDGRGRVAARFTGAVSRSSVRAEIDAMKGKNDVAVPA